MNWYYVENGQEIGPVNDGNLNRLLKEQTIKPETLVWRDGMEKWVPYKQMTIGAEAVAKASETVCSECGRSFAREELTQVEGNLVCAACKPVLLEGAAAAEPAGERRYAGFWIRAGAVLIDIFILCAVNSLLEPFLEMAFDMQHHAPVMVGSVPLPALVMAIVLEISYFTLFIGRFGTTPGKKVCGLKVVRADGGPVTYGRALGRAFGAILSRLSLGAGYVMVAFDVEKRALHDRVCDTRVIRAQRAG